MKVRTFKHITSIASILITLLFQNCQSQAKKSNLASRLIGVWGPSIHENASFRIQSDSIYYPEHFKSFKYTTKNDSIFILFDGWIYKSRFYFRNDSLILKTQNKANRFVRIVE